MFHNKSWRPRGRFFKRADGRSLQQQIIIEVYLI